MGYVTQEAFLFNGTVRENLQLAKRDASDEEMWNALEAAHAAPFVKELPQLLDTNVGERGVKLSGGEKQRLSIARSLLKCPHCGYEYTVEQVQLDMKPAEPEVVPVDLPLRTMQTAAVEPDACSPVA